MIFKGKKVKILLSQYYLITFSKTFRPVRLKLPNTPLNQRSPAEGKGKGRVG